MPTPRIFNYISLLILFFLFGVNQTLAVGFQTLGVNNLKIGIWYPSDSPEQAGRLGPFDVTLAFDAPPKQGISAQFVLMSHGRMGRMRNHHLTAKALANAGFIVVAPTHSADLFVRIGDPDISKALDWRVKELHQAFKHVSNIDSFRRIADFSRIHTLGYSLGGMTALNAMGAGFDLPALETHCQRNDDPGVCVSSLSFALWLYLKTLFFGSSRGVVIPDLLLDIPDRHFPPSFAMGGVAVIAPLGQGVVYDSKRFRGTKLFIVGMEDDTSARPDFHAEHLSNTFSEYVEHFSVRPGHHYAFISPFASRVTDKEHIPIAQDPPDFNRLDFIESINEDLVSFFLSQSSTP